MNEGYLLLVVVLFSTQRESHGAGNPNNHSLIHREHYHEGETELEKEYKKNSSEAKRALRILANNMDKDKDGYVTKDELTSWILTSFVKLEEEDSNEQFSECDSDSDGKMSWTEYLIYNHGFSDEDALANITNVVGEEKKKFYAADVNKDGFLTREEHICLLYLAECPHMHTVEIERFVKEHDKDGDGIITKDDYIGNVSKINKEHLVVREERFGDYDKNKDNKLDEEEIKNWVIPNHKEAATEEAERLLERTDQGNAEGSDEGKDGTLSIDEIVNNHEDFVGSQATNYGKYLANAVP